MDLCYEDRGSGMPHRSIVRMEVLYLQPRLRADGPICCSRSRSCQHEPCIRLRLQLQLQAQLAIQHRILHPPEPSGLLSESLPGLPCEIGGIIVLQRWPVREVLPLHICAKQAALNTTQSLFILCFGATRELQVLVGPRVLEKMPESSMQITCTLMAGDWPP
ncbi:hypothetical protein MPTK2_1g24650 [Marchantia polymorpha subsp. ruderalis]